MAVRYIRDKAACEKTAWAQRLRARMTPEEEIVWSCLRVKKLGVKFRRQAIIRGWIVDFWCPELRLVIEIDGKWHASRRYYDTFRDSELMRLGIKTVRISNELVHENPKRLAGILRETVAARRSEIERS